MLKNTFIRTKIIYPVKFKYLDYKYQKIKNNPNSRMNVICDLLTLPGEPKCSWGFGSTYMYFYHFVKNVPLSILALVRDLGYKISFKKHGEEPLVGGTRGNINYIEKRIVVDSNYMPLVLHEIGHIVEKYFYDVFDNERNYFNWLSSDEINEFMLFYEKDPKDPYINREEYAAEAFMAYFWGTTSKDINKVINKDNLNRKTKKQIEKNIKFIEKYYARKNPKTILHYYFYKILHRFQPILAGIDMREVQHS